MIPVKVAANEQIRAAQIALGLGDEELLPFLCECSEVRCRAVIRLAVGDYAAARAAAGRSVVAEGHPHEGRTVLTGQGYSVVEE